MTAAESRNPVTAVPKAVKSTLFRIIVIYMGIAITYGLTVPYNDPALSASTKTLKSPIWEVYISTLTPNVTGNGKQAPIR